MKRKKVQTVLTEHLAGMNIDGGAGASSDVVIMKARKGDGQNVYFEPNNGMTMFQWDALWDIAFAQGGLQYVDMYSRAVPTRNQTTGANLNVSLIYMTGPGFCIQLEVKISANHASNKNVSAGFLPSSTRDLSTSEDAYEVEKAIAVIWDKGLCGINANSAQTIFKD